MMQNYQHELGQIRDLLRKNPEGMSVTDLAKALEKNKNTMGRYLDILHISGQVDMRPYGMTKVYTLSRRVPLSAMINYSCELIMVLDSDSRIVDINDIFLRVLHLSRQQVIGMKPSFLNPPDPGVFDLLETISSGTLGQNQQITLHLKEGARKYFRFRFIPAVFENGNKGRAVMGEDITEHVIAEKKTRGAEERFEMMAETVSDGLVVAENEQLVFANGRISEITGYSHNDLIGMRFSDLMMPEDYGRCEQTFRNTRSKSRITSRFTAWIKCRDGVHRCIVGKATVVWQDSASLSYVAITDISESMEQEQRCANRKIGDENLA
jgi:PAS domain S-box-containing protein